jgi:hypothetical protein
MSDSYDDYESKMQLAEHAWEKRVGEMVKTKHDKQIEIAQAYERGWNAALAQRQWVGLTEEEINNSYLFWVVDQQDVLGFGKSLETKLKRKNT